MTTMTKTKAAETIAIHLCVNYRKNGGALTKLRAEELVSEMRGSHLGFYLQGVARIANPKTVLRLAIKNLKDNGEL